MHTAIKSYIINLALIVASASALLFSMVATWLILHESVAIIRHMPVSNNAVICSSIGIGLVLLWLNSMLIDSVIWSMCKCWTKGTKNE